MQRALVQQLRSWRAAGVTHLPRPSERPPETYVEPVQNEVVAAAEPRPARELLAPSSTNLANAPLDMPRTTKADRIAALTVLAEEVAGCRACDELARTRTQTVFGVGNPNAKLCFLGEAPGADEDAQGEPFVGRAGQLLNRIIEACTLRRGDVYILNTLKCRPPGNRNPAPDELENCRAFLDRQLEIIQPKFICCLGAVAAQWLLDTKAPIGKLRGKFYQYGSAQVAATYHPAYLLRNPAAKKDAWADMKMVMAAMGVEL